MTNELEKTFFDTFGIVANYKYLLIDKTSRFHNEKLFDKTNFIDFIKSGKDYLLLRVIKYPPQITDRILLKLICIVLNTFQTFEVYRIMDIDSLKEKILKLSMLAKNEVYLEVRTLFDEVENE